MGGRRFPSKAPVVWWARCWLPCEPWPLRRLLPQMRPRPGPGVFWRGLVHPRARSGVGCRVLPRGWWDPPALVHGRVQGCCGPEPAPRWTGECGGRRDALGLLLGHFSRCVKQPGSGQRGGTGVRVLRCQGVRVLGRSKGSGREDTRTLLSCSLWDTKARGFLSLVFTHAKARARKLLPWAGSTFLGAT